MPEPQPSYTLNSKVRFSQNTIHHSLKPQSKTNISKKYCLNKPKIIKEFQNSKLFQNTLNSHFLKSYTPRYTYNQKTKYFEKENTQFIQSQYDIDYSSIQNLNKSKQTQTRRLVFLKKKSQKIINQKTQRSLSPLDLGQKSYANNQSVRSIVKKSSVNNQSVRSIVNNQSVRSIAKENQSILNQSKQRKQKQIIRKRRQENRKQREQKQVLRKRRQENRAQITHGNFIQSLTIKETPQNIKDYIKKNPINFTPLKLQSYTPSKLQSFKSKMNRIRNYKTPTIRQKTQKLQSTEFTHSVFNTKFTKSSQILEHPISKKQLELGQKKQDLFKYLQEEIQRLYDIIKQLKLLGYAQEKVNEWVWAYCDNNKKFMQSILFKAQGYKTSLTQHKIIYKLQQIDTAKINCKKFKRTINNQELPLQPTDLSDMINHLEEILISKQYFELKRLQTQIQDTSFALKNNYLDMQDQKGQDIMKLIASFDKKKKLKPMEYYETLNFYQDAKRLETHFGKVKGLTTANKRKCQNLTEVEIQIIRNKK